MCGFSSSFLVQSRKETQNSLLDLISEIDEKRIKLIVRKKLQEVIYPLILK